MRKSCDHCPIPWSPDVFGVWSKQKPPLLFIRASQMIKPETLLLVFLRVNNKDCDHVVCFTSSLADAQRERKNYTVCCSIPQHRAHTRDTSFLCRKQSQLCRVRIGSQSERGGWYDVTPPHRPLVRDRRTNQEAGELKWKWKQRATLNGSKTYVTLIL